MGLPKLEPDMMAEAIDEISVNAKSASDFMRAMSHEGRLALLCHLINGEKSVWELMDLLSMRQSAISQQLSRLRLEGIVECRRDGKSMIYSLRNTNVKRVVELLQDMFC